jgi:rSAM/selenodomain-associated transferase 1
MNKQLLLIMSKNPIPGTVKTRLAVSIGDAAALTVYEHLLERTAEVAQKCAADVRVCYSPQVLQQDVFEPETTQKVLQSTGDLGQRMSNAFLQAFEDGYEQVCIIGCDCYALDSVGIDQAFALLQKHSAVIGPSEDGGYYLLGLSKMYQALFENKKWSTDQVFDASCKDLEQAKCSYAVLQTLNDIDVYDDLPTALRLKFNL